VFSSFRLLTRGKVTAAQPFDLESELAQLLLRKAGGGSRF